MQLPDPARPCSCRAANTAMLAWLKAPALPRPFVLDLLDFVLGNSARVFRELPAFEHALLVRDAARCQIWHARMHALTYLLLHSAILCRQHSKTHIQWCMMGPVAIGPQLCLVSADGTGSNAGSKGSSHGQQACVASGAPGYGEGWIRGVRPSDSCGVAQVRVCTLLVTALQNLLDPACEPAAQASDLRCVLRCVRTVLTAFHRQLRSKCGVFVETLLAGGVAARAPRQPPVRHLVHLSALLPLNAPDVLANDCMHIF